LRQSLAAAAVGAAKTAKDLLNFKLAADPVYL